MGNFAAQDRTQDDQNPNGIDSEESPPNDSDFFDDMTNAGKALAGLLAGGAAFVTGLYGGSPTPAAGGAATPVPSASETVVLERDRRREEEEGGVADNQERDRTNDQPDSDLVNSNDTSEFASVIDPMNPNSTDPVGVGGVDIPPNEFTSDGETNPGQDIVLSRDDFQKDVEAGAANRKLMYDPSTDTYVPISGIGRSYTADELANLHQADVQAGKHYKTGDGANANLARKAVIDEFASAMREVNRDKLKLITISGAVSEHQIKVVQNEKKIATDKVAEVNLLKNKIKEASSIAVQNAEKNVRDGNASQADKTIANYASERQKLETELGSLGIGPTSSLDPVKQAKRDSILESLKLLDTNFNKAIAEPVSKVLSSREMGLVRLVPSQELSNAEAKMKVYTDRMVELANTMVPGDTYQAELNKILNSKEYKEADALLKSAEAKYKIRLNEILKGIDIANPTLTLTTLEKISPDYIEVTKKIKTETVLFHKYLDSNGNEHYLPSDNPVENIKLLRSMQEADFVLDTQKINALGSIKLDPNSGEITHGLDGKLLKKDDYVGRKNAFDEVKKLIPNFNSEIDASHAKLEALNNFQEVTEKDRKYFQTKVNGIQITTMNDAKDLNFDAFKASSGSTWLDVANAAKAVGADSLSINSIIKPGSHSEGYALDVGSITVKNENDKPVTIHLSYLRDPNRIEQKSPQAEQFISEILNRPGTQFVATPWEVRVGGKIYENKFHVVEPKSLWSQKGANIEVNGTSPGLSAEEVESVYTQISKETGLDLKIPNQKEIIRNMWNHRHHLHVSEVGSSSSGH